MARLYLLLAIIGTVLPLAVFFGLIGSFPAVEGRFCSVSAPKWTVRLTGAGQIFTPSRKR